MILQKELHLVVVLRDALPVSLLDGPLSVAGSRPFSTLLLLPIHAVQVYRGLPVLTALHGQTFMTDGDLQTVSRVGQVLYARPPFPPKKQVFALVVFPVFPGVEALWRHGPGGDHDVDMGVISGRIVRVEPLMDGGYRAEIVGQEVVRDVLPYDLDPFAKRKLIGKRADKGPGGPGIVTALRILDLITQKLEITEFLWGLTGLENMTV